jgi:peptidyl-prolyl cis-trans isomerase SurA
MKKWGWTLVGLLLAVGLNAQALDQPVATIKLDKKTSVVSQKTFRDRVAAIEASQSTKLSADTKAAVLQELITAELIKMDMDAQGIKATDEDLLKQFRSSNPGMTDTQIRSEVEKQSGKSWDEATVAIKRQVASMKYFNQFPAAQEIGKVTVSDKEIQDFFEANTALFTAPDFVRLSHIFFDTKVKPKGTLAEIQKKAEDTRKKIASGQATFEEMASTVSDDTTSAKLNGDIGFIPRSLESQAGQQLLTVFGKDFLNTVFALKKGEVSEVLTSNSGLHIVRVTQKIDKHFMTLDEPVYPGKDETVRAAIRANLQQRKMAAAQAKMINDIGDDLKKKATIKTFEQNF